MVEGLGSDNCRIAAAHAVHNGLTVLNETHNMPFKITLNMVLDTIKEVNDIKYKFFSNEEGAFMLVK
jgi:hypothetical protein